MKRLFFWFSFIFMMCATTAWGGCFDSLKKIETYDHKTSNLIKWEPANGMMGMWVDTNNDKIADVIYYLHVETHYTFKCTDCKDGKEDLQEFAKYFLFRTAVIPYDKDLGGETVLVLEERNHGDSFIIQPQDEKKRKPVKDQLYLKEILIEDVLPDPEVYKITKGCVMVHIITQEEREMEQREREYLKAKDY